MTNTPVIVANIKSLRFITVLPGIAADRSAASAESDRWVARIGRHHRMTAVAQTSYGGVLWKFHGGRRQVLTPRVHGAAPGDDGILHHPPSATSGRYHDSMQLYIDTANLNEIKQAAEMGVLDGVTTNPSLVSKEGVDFHKRLKEICEIVNGPVSAEVVSVSP